MSDEQPLQPTAPSIDILLVEDNPLDARATFHAARKLELAGNIEVVTDGHAALEYLRATPPARPSPGLILLDLNLPGKDGHEVLTEIRADPVLRATPVVVLTTSADEGDVLRAYRRGANAYITKPDGLEGWLRVISIINEFWLSVARLPRS
ncbi:MAG: response regulator [Acidimicrobiales bacterium]